MSATYSNLRRGFPLGLVKLALGCAKLLVHLTSRRLTVTDARSVLQRADAGLCVPQLLYESGDFLRLRLCQIGQRRRSRKFAARLQGRSARNVGLGGIIVCHTANLVANIMMYNGSAHRIREHGTAVLTSSARMPAAPTNTRQVETAPETVVFDPSVYKYYISSYTYSS